MCVLSKRAFNRQDCEARIKYGDFDGTKYLDAKMLNSSEGGMYFESTEAIQPGTDILIKVLDYIPGVHPLEAYNGYRGEVIWCRKVYSNGRSHYGVGIRFMVNICSQCGCKVAYSDIHRTSDFLFLCTSCLKQLNDLPTGKIKECFENFLLGNVL